MGEAVIHCHSTIRAGKHNRDHVSERMLASGSF
jgi:hypothetical protein